MRNGKTDDETVLDDWHPVADDVPAAMVTTRLLGQGIRVGFDDAGRPRAVELDDDGAELRGLPVRQRFGCVWTTLGTPRKELFDVAPEAYEPDRRFIRCGWVTLRTSAPRIVENFLDMAHFPFVHKGILGAEPWTEVQRYQAEIRRDVDEVWATNCRFFQPRVAVSESDGDYARLTYRVPTPFTVMLYRVCPTAPDRLDAIILCIHPVDELLCRAQPIMYLVDSHSADNDLLSFEQTIFLQDRFIVENQRPLALPLNPSAEVPTRADTASMVYRRWLREKGLKFGTVPEPVSRGAQ